MGAWGSKYNENDNYADYADGVVDESWSWVQRNVDEYIEKYGVEGSTFDEIISKIIGHTKLSEVLLDEPHYDDKYVGLVKKLLEFYHNGYTADSWRDPAERIANLKPEMEYLSDILEKIAQRKEEWQKLLERIG